MHDSWETVIAGLTSIDMIIGMNQFIFNLSSQDLSRSVCNNLIGIHVGLCSWTGLPDHQRKVIIKFTSNHLICSFDDGFRNVLLEAVAKIDLGYTFFEDSEGANERYGHAIGIPGNIKILQRSLSLSSPIFISRNLNRAKGISLFPKLWNIGTVDIKQPNNLVEPPNH